MKRTGFVIAIAAFIGVLAALQFDHALHGEPFLESRPQLAEPSITAASLESESGPTDFRLAAKKVIPCVVSVDRYQQVNQGFFSDDVTVEETGTGSGVIVSPDGYIITNNHVVAGAVAVKVRANDHHVYNAKVLGTDPRSDLAVIKITASGLKPIDMGDSDSIEVGQWVLAVGNPLGFDNTVSVGVVSSLKRRLPVGNGELLNAIQTDAAINPGNSGGALTDASGKLIGINSAIASGTGQSVGIGFAIPVNRVREVFNDIVKFGYAKYADLGVRFTRRYDGFLADPGVRDQLAQITGSDAVPSSGVIVKADQESQEQSVIPGSGADKAGLKEWDVILSINGQDATDSVTVNRLLTPFKPGQKVQVKYWSKGYIKATTVTLGEGHGE